MNLTAENVDRIFRDCLFPEAPADDAEMVIAEVIMMKVGFVPEKIEEHKAAIAEMLTELPIEFQPKSQGGGEGTSFLNMCMRNDGEMWTGMHQTMDELLALGIASKQMQILLPRGLWNALPGGMPYVGVVRP